MSVSTWIQLPNQFFSQVKVCLLRAMPKGDEMLVFYMELLCLASRLECNGSFALADTPYSHKEFAVVTKRTVNFTKKALQCLLELKLIEKEDDLYYIPDWYEFESENRLEKLRAYDRERKRKKRAEQKAMADYVRWTTSGNS